jgi:D-alanyl-D-alanine endopeptidase (penicillin-binding protein 7)
MKKTLVATVAALSLVLLPTLAEAAHHNKKKSGATSKVKKAPAHGRASKAARAEANAEAAKVAHLDAASEAAHRLVLQSSAAVVADQTNGSVLFEKNAGAVLPIASISKLMTAMVSLDAKPNLSEVMTIADEDVDTLKGTHSRLRVGTQLTREEMLRLALMSSENRAASSLSRYYPGGRAAFVVAMNQKAKSLGLTDTHFEDPTGLTSANVSSARDLVRMVTAAHQYPLIREFTTTAEYEVKVAGRPQMFRNTNPLVRAPQSSWEIGLSKTGYINEAGKCLVMQAWLNNKPTIIVLLDSWGKLTRIGDANRIKRWIESASVASRTKAG